LALHCDVAQSARHREGIPHLWLVDPLARTLEVIGWKVDAGPSRARMAATTSSMPSRSTTSRSCSSVGGRPVRRR